MLRRSSGGSGGSSNGSGQPSNAGQAGNAGQPGNPGQTSNAGGSSRTERYQFILSIASIISSIVTVILSAVVVGWVSQNAWESQYKTTQQDNLVDKVDERKFEVFKEIAAQMAKHQTLLYPKMQIALAGAIQHYGKTYTPETYRTQYEDLKKNFPVEFPKSEEFDQIYTELLGSFYMAEAMFGPRTDAAITKYISSIEIINSETYLEEYVIKKNQQSKPISETKDNKQIQVQIDVRDFINVYNPAILAAREELVQAMSDENKCT